MQFLKDKPPYYLLIGLLIVLDPITYAFFNYSSEVALSIFLVFLIFSTVSTISLFFSRDKFKDYLIAFYLSINLLSFKLVPHSIFGDLSLVILLLIFLLLYLFFYFSYQKNSKKIFLFFLVITIPALVLNFLNSSQNPNDSNQNEIISKTFSQVKLDSKPNIYLISFDSMTSSSWQKKYLGKKLGYINSLERDYKSHSGFNLYVPSLHAINAIARFDQDHKISGDLIPGLGLVSGENISPLYSLLAANGYEINFNHYDLFYGPRGKHLDRLRTASSLLISNTAACRSFSELQRNIVYLGACSRLFRHFTEDVRTWPAIALDDAMQSALSEEKPQFNLFYFYVPMEHTSHSYNHENESHRNKFLSKYEKNGFLLEELLQKISKEINEKDPNSIVIVFGDHGPYLSRNSDCNINREFCIHNSYGANISVLQTKNSCSSNYEANLRGKVITPSEVLIQVLDCLESGNEQPLSKISPYRHKVEISPGNWISLEDYLY